MTPCRSRSGAGNGCGARCAGAIVAGPVSRGSSAGGYGTARLSTRTTSSSRSVVIFAMPLDGAAHAGRTPRHTAAGGDVTTLTPRRLSHLAVKGFAMSARSSGRSAISCARSGSPQLHKLRRFVLIEPAIQRSSARQRRGSCRRSSKEGTGWLTAEYGSCRARPKTRTRPEAPTVNSPGARGNPAADRPQLRAVTISAARRAHGQDRLRRAAADGALAVRRHRRIA